MSNYIEKINTVIHGDVLETLKTFPDSSIDCVVTSPPYWQLRDYGYPEQWGLEPTFQEYLEHLWQFMNEVWRVLKPTGTVWINLGDTYGTKSGNMNAGNITDNFIQRTGGIKNYNKPNDFHKCQLLLPHRFAIGCIERGWIMRNDIVWGKRNAMPESVIDRFSNKHEYFFLMVKENNYYFDLDSVRDKHIWAKKDKRSKIKGGVKNRSGKSLKNLYKTNGSAYNPKGKNPGDVSDFWNILTRPSNVDHFATYNPDLRTKPIIAGCPIDGIVVDPFAGIGTTITTALKLNRKGIGIEASKEYSEVANQNICKAIYELNAKKAPVCNTVGLSLFEGVK